MLDNKEKLVMKYLCQVCPDKRTRLICSASIAENLSNKYVVSVSELDEIMMSLSKDNYLDYVISDSKKGYYYCISLKDKGLTFLHEQKKAKKEMGFLIARTLFLAGLSFVVGVLLKMIFK